MAASPSQIISAVFILFLIGILVVAGFVVAGKLPGWREDAREQLRRKHIDLSRDGVKLGVKDISNEEYMDRMQKAFVGAVKNSHANVPNKRYTVRRWKNQNGELVEQNVPLDRSSTTF